MRHAFSKLKTTVDCSVYSKQDAQHCCETLHNVPHQLLLESATTLRQTHLTHAWSAHNVQFTRAHPALAMKMLGEGQQIGSLLLHVCRNNRTLETSLLPLQSWPAPCDF